jgi:hypothetical protein
MSPSPELDLSSPEYDDGSAPFANESHPPTSVNISHNRRAQSPPLEREEKEFTQTATFLQQRRRSQDAEAKRESSASTEQSQSTDVTMDDIPEVIEETEESAALKNSEAAAALFGSMDHLSAFQTDFASSSPLLKQTLNIEMPPPLFKPGEVIRYEPLDDSDWNWSEMKSPEAVELDELDDLLGEF